MSYEYKDYFKRLHINESRKVGTDLNDSFNARDELNEVYAQAEKADEYEKSKHRTHVNDCKAEAFDAILKSYDEALSEGHMADEVSNIIEKYESGEYDA